MHVLALVPYALMASGELEAAKLEIMEALEERPLWESLRAASAMVDYFSGLSKSAVPPRYAPWPEPVDWPLVKRDDQSLQQFRRAREIFATLASQTEFGEEQREIYNTWRLACLANDPECQEAAVEFCKTLLEKNPTNHRALAWAIARNFSVDLLMSEEALEKYLGMAEDKDGRTED